MSLMPKLDNTKIKVKTTGTFGTGFNAEEKEIPYSEYKENPDDYAPLVTDQLKGLQLQENALKEELSQLTLSTPIPYTNKMLELSTQNLLREQQVQVNIPNEGSNQSEPNSLKQSIENIPAVRANIEANRKKRRRTSKAKKRYFQRS